MERRSQRRRGDDREALKPFRLLRPPAKVRIDLSALYPHPPHHKSRYTPEGFDAQKVIVGDVVEWSLTTEGLWLGCVTYNFESMYRNERVTHWVPSWVLRPI